MITLKSPKRPLSYNESRWNKNKVESHQSQASIMKWMKNPAGRTLTRRKRNEGVDQGQGKSGQKTEIVDTHRAVATTDEYTTNEESIHHTETIDGVMLIASEAENGIGRVQFRTIDLVDSDTVTAGKFKTKNIEIQANFPKIHL